MDYQDLAGHSRVWIYQSSRTLSDEEVTEIKQHGDNFIKNWAAHGSQLSAALEVFHNLFIVVFADESQVQASGCSIDSSVHFIKKIQEAYGIDLFDRLNIAFKTTTEIDVLRMNDFQIALEKGLLNENTMVFNNLVETKVEFDTAWLVPVKESWHSQLLSY
jgi:DNA phosphorothioation-dependent restriction protein DptG